MHCARQLWESRGERRKPGVPDWFIMVMYWSPLMMATLAITWWGERGNSPSSAVLVKKSAKKVAIKKHKELELLDF
jgi:hypothetical protein